MRPAVRPAEGLDGSVGVVWFHGNTSRFYDLAYIRLGQELAGLGYTFITGNTHGHDVTTPIWDADGEATAGGAAWERFEEVPLDVAAWIDYAQSLGSSRVALAGHSYGAAKVVYYQALKDDPRVAGAIAASPDVKYKPNPGQVALAKEMETQGRADDLLPLLEGNPAWYRLSARAVLGRARTAMHVYRSDTQTPYIASLRCPPLAFYGTGEAWLGGTAELETIRQNAMACPRVDTHLLEGADHVYWGRAAEAAALIAGWIEGVVSDGQ